MFLQECPRSRISYLLRSALLVVALFGTVVRVWAAETPSSALPQMVLLQQEVRPLPGSLDAIPVLNSNSPEIVKSEGVLVSTLPGPGAANLNYAFNGRFDIFAHHIARADNADKLRTLYLGVLLVNPSSKPVEVEVLSAASYLSQPDAPFIELAAYLDNPLGTVFAGPGDRVTDDILRGSRQRNYPRKFVVPPKSIYVFANLPIPVTGLTPPLNGRTLLAQLKSFGVLRAATAAMFARENSDGSERAPNQQEWKALLDKGEFAGPREAAPTVPGAPGAVAYGRVGGVSRGAEWNAKIIDKVDGASTLTLPQPGTSVSFPISTVERGTFGTKQVQSAPMIVREPDTAYAAHGNYGVKYDLTLPVENKADGPVTFSLLFQTPLKKEDASSLSFFAEPSKRVFFRGTIKVSYSQHGCGETMYKHVVQHQGEQGQPLLKMTLDKGDRADIRLEFIYPADATPPQVVTLQTYSQLQAEQR